jgi:hypothetical protein
MESLKDILGFKIGVHSSDEGTSYYEIQKVDGTTDIPTFRELALWNALVQERIINEKLKRSKLPYPIDDTDHSHGVPTFDPGREVGGTD